MRHVLLLLVVTPFLGCSSEPPSGIEAVGDSEPQDADTVRVEVTGTVVADRLSWDEPGENQRRWLDERGFRLLKVGVDSQATRRLKTRKDQKQELSSMDGEVVGNAYYIQE